MIGKAFNQMERAESRVYLLRAVELAPQLAEAWNLLAYDAMRRGEDSLHHQYQFKATTIDPKNADYAFGYANYYRARDKHKFDSLMLDVAIRFRGTEEEAQAYYWLSEATGNKQLKAAYYRQLEEIFNQRQSPWARTGLEAYFSFLVNEEPEKAFKLALNTIRALKTRIPEWRHKMNVAKAFIDVRGLLEENKPELALKVLQTVKLRDRFFDSYVDADEKLRLLAAESLDAASRTQAAYDSLLVFYSRRPLADFYKALSQYGGKLGKDSITIRNDITVLRNAGSRPADSFSLTNYLTDEKVTLSDLKGKVTLISFWFPGCGPCRAEFPHLEKVIRQFSQNKVAYLGINGLLEQDDYVVPFMRGTGYSFMPLRKDPGQKMDVLTADSYPRNYLLDQTGRVIFSDFQINEKNEAMLETMIRELLEAAAHVQSEGREASGGEKVSRVAG